MRSSEKSERSHLGNDVFGVDFHDFIQNHDRSSNFELASEFGLSLREVQKLKKQMQRNYVK